jgi:hypothetical protein
MKRMMTLYFQSVGMIPAKEGRSTNNVGAKNQSAFLHHAMVSALFHVNLFDGFICLLTLFVENL